MEVDAFPAAATISATQALYSVIRKQRQTRAQHWRRCGYKQAIEEGADEADSPNVRAAAAGCNRLRHRQQAKNSNGATRLAISMLTGSGSRGISKMRDNAKYFPLW